MPNYKQLAKVAHPEYDADYWRRIRALYAGGKQLLRDRELLKELFPRHNAETEDVYQERMNRAFYIPYLGLVVDQVVASLSSDPLLVKEEKDDQFWKDFFENVSPHKFKKMGINAFACNQIRRALLFKRSWALVELPKKAELEQEPSNLAQQEASGELRAYVCPLEPENVRDWECDDEGNLIWALLHFKREKRNGLAGDRDVIREEWMYYTSEYWAQFAIEYKKDNEPKDEQEIPLIDQGTHSFGRVPLVSLELDEGLWAGNKIESLAVEHFNKRCALSWGEYKSLFQFLVAKLGPPDALNAVTDDPNRAMNQPVGQGRIVVLGAKDDLGFVGPDAAPFEVALKDLNNLRDEMFRVLSHMALSVDNSGAALQRAAESKQVDENAAAIVLRKLGLDVREFIDDVYQMVEAGRGDKPSARLITGMAEFEDTSLETLIAQALELEGIKIPSATFQVEHKGELCRKALRSKSTPDKLAKIVKELEEGFKNEDLVLGLDPRPEPATGAPGVKPAAKKKPAKKAA